MSLEWLIDSFSEEMLLRDKMWRWKTFKCKYLKTSLREHRKSGMQLAKWRKYVHGVVNPRIEDGQKTEQRYKIRPGRGSGRMRVLLFRSRSWADAEQYRLCRSRSAASCSRAVDPLRSPAACRCRTSASWVTGCRSWTKAREASRREHRTRESTYHPAPPYSFNDCLT